MRRTPHMESPTAPVNARGAEVSAGQARTSYNVTPAASDDNGPVAVVPKNRAAEVRVSLSIFKGHHLIDVRVFALGFDGAGPKPTREGVSLQVSRLPELVRALQAAEALARQRGLITD